MAAAQTFTASSNIIRYKCMCLNANGIVQLIKSSPTDDISSKTAAKKFTFQD